MDIDGVINALKDTPIPTILVIAGIVFLLLAIAGQLTDRIAVAPERRRWAAVIGGWLIAIGVALHVVPQTRLISRGTEEAPTSRPATPVVKDQRPQPSEVSPSTPPSMPESSAQASTEEEEKESNDEIAHATFLTEGTTVRGSITTEEDRVFFKFNASSTKTRIILRTRFPLGIDIYDHAENRIRSKDSDRDRTFSYFFESSPGFIYYILVKPKKFHARAYGDYELVIEKQ